MIKLGDKDKVSVLLELQAAATKQLDDTKKEEMEWLKVFLLVYSGILAWCVSRWFGLGFAGSTQVAEWNIPMEENLIRSMLVGGLIATAVFEFLFLNLRHSYYRVRRRLESIQKQLSLFDSPSWGGEAPLKEEWLLGEIKGRAEWWEKTKPYSSFFTRSIYLLVAYAAVIYMAWKALAVVGGNPAISELYLWWLFDVGVFGVFTGVDLWHFKGERE